MKLKSQIKTLNKTLTAKTLSIFWQHAKKYPLHVAILILGILAVESLQTYTPLVYKNLINLLANHPTEIVFKNAIRLVAYIFILNGVRIVLWRLVTFVNNYFQPRVMANLTNSCYQYLQKHSYTFFNSSFIGSLVTKVKRYERSFEQISDQIIFDLGRAFLDTTMILGIIFWQYHTYGLIILVWSIIYIGFSYGFSLYKLPYDIARADADTQTTAQLADSLSNNINVKLFTGYAHENKRFANVTSTQFSLRKKSWDLATWSDLIQSFLMICLEFGVMYLAVKDWRHSLILVGDVALLQGYILRISDKLWNTGKNIRNIYEAIADGNEMTAILLSPHEVEDPAEEKSLNVPNGAIELKNVSFSYGGRKNVMKNFNLTIPSGQRVAIIGPSGGGKSTITKLLFRFLDIQKGEILIDNQNISQVTQDSLRKNISLVPQEPILFHRSLMENIRYAKQDATDQEIIKAAKLAHCHEFINSLPEKYGTFVGERGVKLSGGERQRVAIARAILKNAPILILDEATSSLDSESEKLIQDALRNLMKNKTTIVIAHRLSTIMEMDRIVVIEHGKITEEGKHEELLKAKQGTYQKLWGIQAGSFT